MVMTTACSQRTGEDGGGPDYDYVPCSSDVECLDVSVCTRITWRDGDGSMCTAACLDETECPHGGRCLDVVGSGVFLCHQRCVRDADCPATFICQPLSTGGSVCLPG